MKLHDFIEIIYRKFIRWGIVLMGLFFLFSIVSYEFLSFHQKLMEILKRGRKEAIKIVDLFL